MPVRRFEAAMAGLPVGGQAAGVEGEGMKQLSITRKFDARQSRATEIGRSGWTGYNNDGASTGVERAPDSADPGQTIAKATPRSGGHETSIRPPWSVTIRHALG